LKFFIKFFYFQEISKFLQIENRAVLLS